MSLGRKQLRGESKKVLEQVLPLGRGDRLGVELYAVNRQRPMAHRHDLLSCRTVLRPGAHLQLGREPGRGYDQAVIPRRDERVRQAGEEVGERLLVGAGSLGASLGT